METASRRSSQGSPESLRDTGEAMPLPRVPSGPHASVRGDARRRRVMTKVLVACSSAVALAVVGICYALLSP